MIEARVMLRRRGGLTEQDSRKIAPLLIKIAIDLKRPSVSNSMHNGVHKS